MDILFVMASPLLAVLSAAWIVFTFIIALLPNRRKQ